GLGSNRSIWLGPPVMNKKMQRLARAGDGPGPDAGPLPGAAARDSRSSRSARPSSPNPPPAALRNSRRLRGWNGCGPGQLCGRRSGIPVFLAVAVDASGPGPDGSAVAIQFVEKVPQFQSEFGKNVAAV